MLALSLVAGGLSLTSCGDDDKPAPGPASGSLANVYIIPESLETKDLSDTFTYSGLAYPQQSVLVKGREVAFATAPEEFMAISGRLGSDNCPAKTAWSLHRTTFVGEKLLSIKVVAGPGWGEEYPDGTDISGHVKVIIMTAGPYIASGYKDAFFANDLQCPLPDWTVQDGTMIVPAMTLGIEEAELRQYLGRLHQDLTDLKNCKGHEYTVYLRFESGTIEVKGRFRCVGWA